MLGRGLSNIELLVFRQRQSNVAFRKLFLFNQLIKNFTEKSYIV